MLVEKAMDYEKTSYRGLFNFIRYIEKLQKYEVDFGEVNLADAGSGAVQIMTIHKSQGTEKREPGRGAESSLCGTDQSKRKTYYHWFDGEYRGCIKKRVPLYAQ